MKALKDIYTHKGIFRRLADDMKVAYPSLNKEMFYNSLIKNLHQLELKMRIERAADTCHEYFPKNYRESIVILNRFVKNKENHFIYTFLPAFVAKYGAQDFDLSIAALRDFTQYSSSKFGVRTFLELDLKRTLNSMIDWAKSDNAHVRRLASEGSRPRLPWAKKIDMLIEKPQLAWPILEKLRCDQDKYVQKSVANHINDISKDHPYWIVKKIKTWDSSDPSTAWIIKHGLRGLIKSGNREALELFGYHKIPNVDLYDIKWEKSISKNDRWKFSLMIKSLNNRPQKCLVDYRIFFKKKNGKLMGKTFKLKQFVLSKQHSVRLSGSYIFKDLTTRKHYFGTHAWQLLINGVEQKRYEFQYNNC